MAEGFLLSLWVVGGSAGSSVAVTSWEVSAARQGEGPIIALHSPLSAPEGMFGEIPSSPEGQCQDTLISAALVLSVLGLNLCS